MFESKYKEDAFDPQLWRKTNMPHAVVEVADCKMAGKIQRYNGETMRIYC